MQFTHANLRIVLTPVLGALALLIVPATAQDEEDRGDELRQMYMEYLTDEGYRPSVDKDGDVVFKYEGHTYFVDVHNKDAEFFMLALANIWPIESEEERLQVLAAADYVNREAKAAKVSTKDDDVWITVEMFVAKPEDFKGVFARALDAIGTGVEYFVAEMKK